MPQAKSTRHPRVMSLMLAIMLTVYAFQPQVWAAEFGTGMYLLGYQSSLSGYQPAPGSPSPRTGEGAGSLFFSG